MCLCGFYLVTLYIMCFWTVCSKNTLYSPTDDLIDSIWFISIRVCFSQREHFSEEYSSDFPAQLHLSGYEWCFCFYPLTTESGSGFSNHLTMGWVPLRFLRCGFINNIRKFQKETSSRRFDINEYVQFSHRLTSASWSSSSGVYLVDLSLFIFFVHLKKLFFLNFIFVKEQVSFC